MLENVSCAHASAPVAAPVYDSAVHEVRRLTECTTLLIARDSDPVLVVAPARFVVSILACCDGSSSIAEIAAASDEPAMTLDLLLGLVNAGCLNIVDEEVGRCLEVFR